MRKSKTNRGFKLFKFTDTHNSECSIQESSVFGHIWLGISDLAPQVMAIHAKRLGIHTTETTGFIPYHIPEEVVMRTRVHIDKKLAKKLIPILQKFIDTGGL